MYLLGTPPFIACGAKPSKLSKFLSSVQNYCNNYSAATSLVQCLSRMDYLFIITNDYRLQMIRVEENNDDEGFDLIDYCSLDKCLVGLKRIYQVSASYTHCWILVDEIINYGDDNMEDDTEDNVKLKGKYRVNESNEMFFNELPNGQIIKVPRKSSLIAIELHDFWSSILYGKETIKLDIIPNVEVKNAYIVPYKKNGFKENEFITYMTCASSSSVFLTNLGRMFVLGSNEFGECGVTGFETVHTISLSPYSEANPELFISKVACGDHSIFALDSNGLIHCTGYNYLGELGIGIDTESIDTFQPSTELNKYLESDPAIDISCRYYGVIVLTKSGKIYTTGHVSNQINIIDKYCNTQERVLNIGANNNSFLMCFGKENDLFIPNLSNDTEEPLHIKDGLNLLKSGEKVVLVGSEFNSPDAALLCYVQSSPTLFSILQNNLRKHLVEYAQQEGRKSLTDITLITTFIC